MDLEKTLQLGDIVRITSTELKDGTFYINYFDPNDFMELIHVSSLVKHKILLNSGKVLDAGITKISLLNRSLYKGFARQNGLLPTKWVDLEFSGDVRSIVIAQITYLEEDMIELTTYPEKEVLYIDFAYKGIPKNIPLKQICFCNPPVSYEMEEAAAAPVEDEDEEAAEEIQSKYNDAGELEMDIPNNVVKEKDFRKKLHEEYKKNSPPPVDEDVQQEHVHYGIDAQMNILFDDLLSQVPDDKRTEKVMREIYIHLNRFKELRHDFSNRGDYGQITGYVSRDPKHYKPMAIKLYSLQKVPWMLPVINVVKHMYSDKLENEYTDLSIFSFDAVLHQEMETEKAMFWENNVESDVMKYANLYRTLNSNFYSSYSLFADNVIEPIAKKIKVSDDMNCLLGNYEKNESGSMKVSDGNDFIVRRNFNSIRVQGAINYSHFLNKKTNEMRMLMGSDEIDIQSMIMLPKPYVSQCRHLYGNIFEKTKYQAPFLDSVLASTEIKTKQVDIKKDSTILPLETMVQDISLRRDGDNVVHNPNLDHPSYNAFVQSFIPNIFSLIEHYTAENAEKYNLTNYMKTFSPYFVDASSLSFSSSQSIKRHLYKNISNYKADYAKKKASFSGYTLVKLLNNKHEIHEMYRKLNDKYFLFKMAQMFKQNFQLSEKSLGSEDLMLLQNMDDATTFCAMVLLSNKDLITPVNMVEPMMESKNFYDIHQKQISKKYTSLREMQEDNDKRDLKFNTQYDANKYDVLKKYKKEKSQYTPEQFIQFLSQKLADEYGCSMDNTKTLAEELVQGFKLVKEGDYALLETTPELPPGIDECSFTQKEKDEIVIEAKVRKIQKYFKRQNNVWVYDADVNSSSFVKAKDMTCALNEDGETVGKMNRQKIFQNQYGERMEIIEKNINTKLGKLERLVKIKTNMQKSKLMEIDKYHSTLGNHAYISESIPSPYQKNLDMILHKTVDFETKQQRLVEFCNYFCREPYTNENADMLYCNETSIPLVPRALRELARAFQKGEYVKKMALLIKERQIKSEEGRYILVHGGLILEDIDFSDQGMELLEDAEEKDTWDATEGEKIEVEKYDVNHLTGRKLYGNMKLRMVYNIIKAVSKNLYIQVELIEELTMRLCSEFLSDKRIFIGEEKYVSEIGKKAKDPSKVPPYETYEKSKILDITICNVIIAVQCIIPEFVPRRSFGNCVIILNGYPLNENSGSEGTVQYLACILRKMHEDRNTLPWSAIPKGKDLMEKRLFQMFLTCLKNERVTEVLKAKRAYLAIPKENIPATLKIDSKWSRFLPPLQPLNLLEGKTPIRNVDKSVHEVLKNTLKTGSPDQWKYLGMYFCKLSLFSFAVLEIINVIVKEKGSLLGKYGKIHWLENACCNELETSQQPLIYFNTEDERIFEYIKNTEKLGVLLQKTKLYLRSSFIHMLNEKVEGGRGVAVVNSMFCKYSEELMYRTFISYCNLDSEVKPIPLYLEVFINEKPVEYIKTSSFEEKIAILKSKDKKLNLTLFQRLIKDVANHNKISIIQPLQLAHHDQVVGVLTQLKETAKESRVDLLCAQLESYLNREQNSSSLDEDKTKVDDKTKVEDKKLTDDKILTDIENFLELETTNMKLKIKKFHENLKQKKTSFEKLESKLSNWDDNMSHVAFGHFVKNYLYYLCYIVPNYISTENKRSTMTTESILLNEDKIKMNAVLSKKFDYLKEFVKDDLLIPLFEKSGKTLQKMHQLLSKFYGFFPHDRPSLYKRYFVFCLYFIVYFLVVSTEEEIILDVIFQKIREKEDKESNQDDDDDDGDSQLKTAEKGKLQSRVLKFIQALFQTKEMFHRDKSSIVTTYDEIIANVSRLEDAEKIRMMEKFKKITEHRTRRAEKELKKYHLGEYFIDQNVIKRYGHKRNKMLNTEDVTEDDFLFRESGNTEEEEEEEEEDDDEGKPSKYDDIFGEDSQQEDEDDEEEKYFIKATEDEDAFDMSEYNSNR